MTLEPQSIPELLRQRAAAAPDKQFLFSEADKRRYTYTEFEATVRRVAGMLATHGVRKGDVVSLLLPNSVEYVIAYFACWHLGALAGPINSLLKAEEIDYVISNSEAKVLLVNSDFVTRVESKDVEIIVFDTVEGIREKAVEETRIDKNDEAIIIYTSGTTGRSKGAMVTHRNLESNARTLIAYWDFSERDVLLHALPIFHVHGLFVANHCALLSGARLLWHRKFDPKLVLRDL
ncbi:MAG TPA: AMP-binding protein, partial [Pyrinomonadaceae bacterium]